MNDKTKKWTLRILIWSAAIVTWYFFLSGFTNGQ